MKLELRQEQRPPQKPVFEKGEVVKSRPVTIPDDTSECICVVAAGPILRILTQEEGHDPILYIVAAGARELSFEGWELERCSLLDAMAVAAGE